MTGAFRKATYRALCATCRDEAVCGCSRCARPLCEAHAPAAQLCGDCESAFASRLSRARTAYRVTGWLLLLAGNLAILSASRAYGHDVLSLPVVALATLLTWSLFVWMLGMPADDVFRRRFIRASRR